MYRALAVVLFGLSLLIPPHVVFADAIPYPATTVDWCLSWGASGPVTCGYGSNTAACKSIEHSGFVFEYLTNGDIPNYAYEGGYGAGHCWYSIPNNPVFGIHHYDQHWARKQICPKGGYPDDSRLQTPMCICPPGTDFNVPDPVKGGPVCVPATQKCPVDDIPSFGPPDPLPLDVVNMTPIAQAAASCLQTNLGIATSAGLMDSGFRPIAYNDHLANVWAWWWKKLPPHADNPACAALIAKVSNEMSIHRLGRSTERIPYGPNCHSSGTCFDVHGIHTFGVDANSRVCGVRRPYPKADPGHTQSGYPIP